MFLYFSQNVCSKILREYNLLVGRLNYKIPCVYPLSLYVCARQMSQFESPSAEHLPSKVEEEFTGNEDYHYQQYKSYLKAKELLIGKTMLVSSKSGTHLDCHC